MPLRNSYLKQPITKIGVLLTLVAALGISGNVFASGGGSYGGGTSTSAPRIDSERYALGKNVYKNNVNCDGCLVNKSRLSKKEALALYKQVRTDKNLKSSLSKKERRALKYYMQERFKL